MTSRNSQQSDRRTIGTPSALLPVAKGVNADPRGLGELSLGESDESPQRGNIVARLELSEHEPLT
jgi:hypothetical protein